MASRGIADLMHKGPHRRLRHERPRADQRATLVVARFYPAPGHRVSGRDMWSRIGVGGARPPTEQSAIGELSRAVALASNLTDLRRELASEFRRIGRAEGASFLEHDDLLQGYVERACTWPAGRGFRIPRTGGLVQWLEVNEEPLGVPDWRGAHRVLARTNRNSSRGTR